ncbi:MAG: trypsin-like peptidase domain-containing protein [Planctomycetes bacterium]|nr:trypsin-like peptidase domain-containing protein [Planctomycetota bacterium]
MTKRLLAFGLCLALSATLMSATLIAATPRETPLVLAVQRAKNAVVNIHSVKTAFSGEGLFSSGKGRKVNGMGSGILIDERGYIVTNYHVVKGVDSLRITLHDGSTYTARLISADAIHDLAIIKIDSKKALEVMPLGTSSDLMLGETVIAVGNAFGYEHTITSGIISALSRDVEVNESQSYKNLIQTDASINPGNSGGPLLNLDGEVIGINVAIRAGAQRIGFAIPIDDARKVIAELLSIEKMDGTYHGLISKDIKSGKQRQLVVSSARPNSPAEKAGFQSGDVVVQAGTVKVIDRADFERALLGHTSGEKIEILVQREDKEETLTLELAQQKKYTVSSAGAETVFRGNNDANQKKNIEKIWRILGLRLAKLPDNDSRLTKTKYHGGMQVVEVRKSSPAESNGIHKEDILVGLHLWETISYENVAFVLDHPNLKAFNPLKFYIFRKGNTWFGNVSLKLPGGM